MQFIADLHTHTCASTHAFSTITENTAAAKERGIEYLAMTDHGVAMPDSPHLWHFYGANNLPRYINGVFVLRGMEANILDYDGNIDVEIPELYGLLDWVVASYHHPVCAPKDKLSHTKGYIGALKNPHVCCIGHPDDPQFDFDYREVSVACRELHKAIELNATRLRSKSSQQRYREILSVCAEEGTTIVVDSDAHFHDRVGDFAQAAAFLEEMKFPQELILNIDRTRFKNFVISHKGNIFE